MLGGVFLWVSNSWWVVLLQWHFGGYGLTVNLWVVGGGFLAGLRFSLDSSSLDMVGWLVLGIDW